MSKVEEQNPQYTSFIVDESVYETTINKKFANRKNWERPNPKFILSFLPGTILDMYVKAGDKIELGAPLLLFEAMKMHTVVNAPLSGTIKAVNVEAGNKIPKGFLMIEFD